jgi:hypothetical protein
MVLRKFCVKFLDPTNQSALGRSVRLAYLDGLTTEGFGYDGPYSRNIFTGWPA